MSKPTLEEALETAQRQLETTPPLDRATTIPISALLVLAAAARDNFALSQTGGVGARYGVGPSGGGTARVEAWFTDRLEAEAYTLEGWAVPREIWDLVLGQIVERRLEP